MTDTEKYVAVKAMIEAQARAYIKDLNYKPTNKNDIGFGLAFAYYSMAAFIAHLETKPVQPSPLTPDDEMALHELNERDKEPL